MTADYASGAGRKPARKARVPEEEAVAVTGWQVRARQWLRLRAAEVCARTKEKLKAEAISAIDSAAAALQRLRLRAGGTKSGYEGRDRDRARTEKRKQTRTQAERAESEAGTADPVAIKQAKRRLRGLLIYLGAMLLGGLAGMALSYELLELLLDRQSAELRRQETKQLKYAKSVARLTAQVDSGQAKQAKAETRLTQALSEAEKKLAQGEKKLGELEKKRADAEAQLAAALALRVNAVPRPRDGAGSRDAARNNQAAWTRSGDCTLGGDDVRSVLKGCIAEMGRK